jgi:hypothetical protein
VTISGPISHRPGQAWPTATLLVVHYWRMYNLALMGSVMLSTGWGAFASSSSRGVDPQLLRPLNYGLKLVEIGSGGTPDPMDCIATLTHSWTVASIHLSNLSSISCNRLSVSASCAALPLKRL